MLLIIFYTHMLILSRSICIITCLFKGLSFIHFRLMVRMIFHMKKTDFLDNQEIFWENANNNVEWYWSLFDKIVMSHLIARVYFPIYKCSFYRHRRSWLRHSLLPDDHYSIDYFHSSELRSQVSPFNAKVIVFIS